MSTSRDAWLAQRDKEDAHFEDDKFMVFDVESIGLHGEGFAVGWVVVTRGGAKLDEGLFACHPDMCAGTDANRKWVADNVPVLPCAFSKPVQVRNAFWTEWLRWSKQGAILVADYAWPVEARFLAAAADDGGNSCREWQGPYPLHDLASMLLVTGKDPLAVTDRQPDETPAHNPLMDARQSARQLLQCLARVGS